MNIPLRGKNWSEHEREEIGRLEAVCSGTDQWSLECDHTDAGDPLRHLRPASSPYRPSHRAHRAPVRVVWPREGRSAETPRMTAAVEMALERLRAYAPRPSGMHRDCGSRQD